MPGGRGNIRPEDNPKSFKTHPENIGGGRKKKIYTILKEKGYSKDDINTCFGELMFYSVTELEEVVKKKDIPAITIIVAKSLINAIKKSDFRLVKEIIEQVIGKPKQSLEVEDAKPKPPRRINFR